MSDAQVLEIVSQALEIAAKIAGPILITALVVGVLVSVVQAVTQIQEMTLTFVPKLIGIGLAVLLTGNWMLRQLVVWVTDLWQSIPSLV